MDRKAKKELKRRWVAAERAIARRELPLPEDAFGMMFAHLREMIDKHGCDHSRRFTASWLASNQHRISPVLVWMEAHGGHCDCEVVANVEDHVRWCLQPTFRPYIIASNDL